MPDEQYIENILISQGGEGYVAEPMFSDDDCDELFEFKGILKLVRIGKSVQNKCRNTHDYMFRIQEIDKLEKYSD